MKVVNDNPGDINVLQEMRLPDTHFFALVMVDGEGKEIGLEKDMESYVYVSKNPYFRYSPIRGRTVIIHVEGGDNVRLLQNTNR